MSISFIWKVFNATGTEATRPKLFESSVKWIEKLIDDIADDTEDSWPVKIIRLSERHSFLAGRYFISHEWISRCRPVSLAVIQTLDRIYVSWRYTRNRWTLGLDLYTLDVFDENDRIPRALRISLPDATACIRAPVHFTSYCFFHRVHFWIPEAPRRYRYSLSLFFSLSLSLSSPAKSRTIEPASHLDTWPPSFYETSDKRLRAKFSCSFVTRPWQRSDFRPLLLACLCLSHRHTLSKFHLHCSKMVDQVRFFFLSGKNVIDCEIETEFILLFFFFFFFFFTLKNCKVMNLFLSSVYYDFNVLFLRFEFNPGDK